MSIDTLSLSFEHWAMKSDRLFGKIRFFSANRGALFVERLRNCRDKRKVNVCSSTDLRFSRARLHDEIDLCQISAGLEK